MKLKISAIVMKNGVHVDSLSSDFSSILHEMTDKVCNQNQEGSFQYLFWNEQLNALKKSDSRQVRWHPSLIKWCLHLKFISSGAYHALYEVLELSPCHQRGLCAVTRIGSKLVLAFSHQWMISL